MLIPWLNPAKPKIIYAQPETSPLPFISQASLKPLAPFKMPAVSAQEPLETLLHPLMAPGTYSSNYAPGQCTWGVASRLPVPSDWGNANTWDDIARAEGYTVSAAPKVGAIAVSEGDSYWGHVAVVVSTAPLTVWEMNYNGPYTQDTRVATPGEFSSFIYF